MTETEELELKLIGMKIDTELGDEKYATRTHGTLSCHNKGCSGPLCRYAKRTRQRLDSGTSDTRVAASIDEYVAERLAAHHKDRNASLSYQRRSLNA